HNSLNYNSTLFQWYFGMKKSYSFNYSRNLNLEALKGKALKVYMYNPELINVNLSDYKINIVGINKVRH
ncbi:MAG: hypothetical protein QNL29_05720, partial [Crocinitomicaceae bacterium]